MTEDEFYYLISRLFIPEQNHRLQKKGWFRFTQVIQGIAIVVVILITALTAYDLFSQKSLVTATLVCNDGTTWNAIDERYSSGSYKSTISDYKKCGQCNNRLPNDRFKECTSSTPFNLLYNSYEVEETFKKDRSFFEIIGWSSLVLFGGLIFVKIVAKMIIYVLGGVQKEED